MNSYKSYYKDNKGSSRTHKAFLDDDPGVQE